VGEVGGGPVRKGDRGKEERVSSSFPSISALSLALSSELCDEAKGKDVSHSQ